jgi:galactokinase
MSPYRRFAAHFGADPTVVEEAPGRVNLIGEHTDYNGGLVLPVAIARRTRVALAVRDDDRVRLVSADEAMAAGGSALEYTLGAERRTERWIDYVQGCTAALAADGHALRGFDALVTSRVPIGSGLSSSAALEVAMLRALRKAFDLALDDVTLARVAHRAEHDFVGARVGIMDQMAASLGDETTALFLDTRAETWERVPLPAGLGVAVIDSGVTHRHAGGGYNARRAECERAAALLGVESLREVDADGLGRALDLPPPLDRRVRHVVSENARVTDAVAALRAGDTRRLGAILIAGHASLRDDFEVSTPEIDRLVTLARADADVLGARLTGGGFGGAVVLLAHAAAAAEAARRVAAAYAAEVPWGGTVLIPVAADPGETSEAGAR